MCSMRMNAQNGESTIRSVSAEGLAALRRIFKGVRSYTSNYWVAVKELNLSYYIGETLLFTIYTHYGNLI